MGGERVSGGLGQRAEESGSWAWCRTEHAWASCLPGELAAVPGTHSRHFQELS